MLTIEALAKRLRCRAVPFVFSDGLGVNSTAALELLAQHQVRPDAVVMADTGAEKDETYDYLPIRRRRLAELEFPELTIVRYQVQDFKNWPPYHGLDQNCLTNGTLPSLAFGFKSCSMKWKITPQDKWAEQWAPAVAAWAAGKKVLKSIGYDAGPADRRRFAHAVGVEDPRFDYVYPLLAAGWDRDRCKAEIRKAGQPVPPKSACWMCPAVKTEEIREYRKKYLRWIVVMEARAEPRLTDIEGLWRNGCKGTRGAEKRPGKITEFIRAEGLLPAAEIDELIRTAPAEILTNQGRFANGQDIPDWRTFLESFADDDEPCSAHRPGPADVALIQLGDRRKKKKQPTLFDGMPT